MTDTARRLYEALADITADALAVRGGVRDGNDARWASVDNAKRLLDEVHAEFERRTQFWPPERRYP